MTEVVFRTENVTKVYGDGELAVHALRGIDIELFRGELVVLLGPSGSGKSTFLIALVLGYALKPVPVPVDMAAIQRGTLEVTVDDDGETRVKEVFAVSAPVSGQMLRIDSKVGDEVVAGETVLAVMQPTAPEFLDARSRRQAEAEVKAAEAALALAEAERAKAKAELEFAAPNTSVRASWRARATFPAAPATGRRWRRTAGRRRSKPPPPTCACGPSRWRPRRPG